MSTTGLYNCNPTLWESFRKRRTQMPNGGAILVIIDGHVHDGMQFLARFDDDSHAEQVLKSAGFRSLGEGKWK